MMPKFYRYLIYRFYSWRLEENDDTPIGTIVITMSVIHSLQLMMVLFILRKYFPIFNFIKGVNNFAVGLIGILFMVAYYLIVYNKEKWSQYLEEFKNESPKQRLMGSIFVASFTIGTIFLFFMTMIFVSV